MSAPNTIRLITAKDIMYVLGLGERQARRILKKMRQSLGRLRGQRITLEEFCAHIGLGMEVVAPVLEQ